MDLFWRIGDFSSHRQYKIRQNLNLTSSTTFARYRGDELRKTNSEDTSGLPSVVAIDRIINISAHDNGIH
jgi:hypothetical protein